MSLYKIIKNIFSKNILIFFILTNICFLTIFNFSFKENLYSEIEIKFNNSKYLNTFNTFENEIFDKTNFENWKMNSNVQLNYSDISEVLSIEDTYEFLNSKSLLKITNKDNYYAYQFIYHQDDYKLASELYSYFVYIKNNHIKKSIMNLLENEIGLLVLLGFNTNKKFSKEEKNNLSNILINDLNIKLPTEPKKYGINKILLSIFYLMILDLIMIITLMIFKFKFIRKIIFKN